MSRLLMIDLETLDTLPTAMILSIGVISFDPDEKEEDDRSLYIKVDARQSVGTIGADTVMWWLTQNEAARQAIAEPGRSIGSALEELRTFCANHDEIWAGPSYFDITILEHAYRTCSIPIPWPFYKVRDWTTFRRLFGVYKIPPCIEHHALSDAQAQVKGFRQAWAKLRTLGA